MLRRLLVLGAAAVVLFAGCARGDGQAEAVTRTDEVPVTITTELRGGLETTVKERTVTSNFVLVRDDDEAVPDMFGVQPVEPIDEAGTKVLPGFLIAPYKGKGTYTIQPGTPREALKDGKPTNAQRSSVRVEWWPAGGEPQEFLRRVKPCTVKVDDDEGTSGRLRCPELSHEAPGGLTFSLDFRWKAQEKS